MIEMTMMFLFWNIPDLSRAFRKMDSDLATITFEWNHIGMNDTTQFIVDDVDKTLTYVASRVVPKPNQANCSLNTFVEAPLIVASIKKTLLDDAKVTFNTNVDFTDLLFSDVYKWNYVTDLIVQFIEVLTPYLEDALLQRLLILDHLKAARENSQLQLAEDRIRTIVKEIIAIQDHSKDRVNILISKVMNSSLNTEIKEIVCYQVVKTKLTKMMSRDLFDENVSITNIMDTLLSFIREEVNKKDSIVVNQYSTDVVRDGLLKGLIPEYKILIKKAILKANSLNAILKQSHQDDNKIFRDTTEEYLPFIRHALSIYFYSDNFHEISLKCINLRKFNRIMRRNLRYPMDRGGIMGRLTYKLNMLMGRQKPHIKLDDHPTVRAMVKALYIQYQVRVNMEYDSYVETYRSFAKINETILSESVLRLITSKNKEFKRSQVRLLMIYIPKLGTELSDQLKSFQNEIEEDTVKTYGFSHAIFTCSKDYFDILEAVLISSAHSSYKSDSFSISKDEL